MDTDTINNQPIKEDKLAFLRRMNRKDRRAWFFQNRKKFNFKSFWQLTEILNATKPVISESTDVK